MKRIALLSDTHNYLDPRVVKHLCEADEIWHAGDLGSIELLEQLRAIGKPLRAVYGNIDDYRIRAELPEVQRFTVEDVDVYMTHIGGHPGRYESKVLRMLNQMPVPKIVVAGHSHILRVIYDKNHGCLYLNPGACGRYGQQVVRTILRFTLDAGDIRDMDIVEYK